MGPEDTDSTPMENAGEGDTETAIGASFEEALRAVAPGLLDAQRGWLSQIDSLRAPDRKTHELIRMVCSVVARNPPGIEHHAALAAEVGASWEETVGSIVLTQPAFGMLVVVEALPFAQRGWRRGREEQDQSVGDNEDEPDVGAYR